MTGVANLALSPSAEDEVPHVQASCSSLCELSGMEAGNPLDVSHRDRFCAATAQLPSGVRGGPEHRSISAITVLKAQSTFSLATRTYGATSRQVRLAGWEPVLLAFAGGRGQQYQRSCPLSTNDAIV